MLKHIFSVILLGAICSWAGETNGDEKNYLLSPFQVEIVESAKNRNAQPSWLMKITQGAVSIEDVPEIGDIRLESRALANALRGLIDDAAREGKMLELVGSGLKESTQERRYLILEAGYEQALFKSSTDIAQFAAQNPAACKCRKAAAQYGIDPWTIVIPDTVGTSHKIGLYQPTAKVPQCIKDIYLNAFQREKFEELLGNATENSMMLAFSPAMLDLNLKTGCHIINKTKTVADVFQVSKKKITSKWRPYTALEFRRKFGEGASPESKFLCCLIPDTNLLGLNASGWHEANKKIQAMWFYETFLVNEAYLNLPFSRRKALEIPVDLVFDFGEEGAQSQYEPVPTSEKTLE
jgi:hypothetical protein